MSNKLIEYMPDDAPPARFERFVASYANDGGTVRISLTKNMDPNDWYICITLDGSIIERLPGRQHIPVRYEKYERIVAGSEMAALSYFHTLCLMVSGYWVGFWAHMDNVWGIGLTGNDELEEEANHGTELEESGS